MRNSSSITGIILAGGRATRMGGKDKGLVELAGRPLATHVLERLRPQVGDIVINANRNQDAYRGFGCPVIPDRDDAFRGPLAGIAAVMQAVDSELFVSVPCDAPLLPENLVQRLLEALPTTAGPCSVACSEGVIQPVFALFRKSAVPLIERYLEAGEKKVRRWHRLYHSIPVEFDHADPFVNINTEAQLRSLEERLGVPERTDNGIE